jgi:hypothetical protein
MNKFTTRIVFMIGREGKLPKPGFGKAIFEYPKRLPSKKRNFRY